MNQAIELLIKEDTLGHTKLHDIIKRGVEAEFNNATRALEDEHISLQGTHYLHYTLKKGSKKYIPRLIELGAEPHLSTITYPSLVSIAIKEKDSELLDIVINKGGEWLSKYPHEDIEDIKIEAILKIAMKKDIDKLACVIAMTNIQAQKLAIYAETKQDIELICLIKKVSPREILSGFSDNKIKNLALDLI